MNIHGKEFYPAGHVGAVKDDRKRRRGRRARWAVSEISSDKMTSARATVKNDGDAEEEARHDDDAGPAPVVEVGNAEVPVVDDLPLGNDGKRDLKAEAISLEHMMTHAPLDRKSVV